MLERYVDRFQDFARKVFAVVETRQIGDELAQSHLALTAVLLID